MSRVENFGVSDGHEYQEGTTGTSPNSRLQSRIRLECMEVEPRRVAGLDLIVRPNNTEAET